MKTKSENALLMAEARDALKGRWDQAVGIYFVWMLITIITGSMDGAGPILQLLVDGPLYIGIALISLAIARGQETSLKTLFEGFNDFLRSLAAYVILVVFIMLWSLLLIVPGIIAALAYAQTFFILAEDKTVTAREAIRKSKDMMYGHKKELFYLSCRFIGWFLLSILTLGIGFLWFMPYVNVTLAKFYDQVRAKKAEKHSPAAA